MGRVGSNHGSNKVESWVEQGRIVGRSASRNIGETWSNYSSNMVESWVELDQTLGQAGLIQLIRVESTLNMVKSGVKQGKSMIRIGLNHG